MGMLGIQEDHVTGIAPELLRRRYAFGAQHLQALEVTAVLLKLCIYIAANGRKRMGSAKFTRRSKKMVNGTHSSLTPATERMG